MAYLVYNYKGELTDNSYLITMFYGMIGIAYCIYIFNKFEYTNIEKVESNSSLFRYCVSIVYISIYNFRV